MFNLILKDILIQKKNVAIVLAYVIGSFFFFSYMPYGIFTVIIAATVYIISQGAFWIDEKNNADFMLNSLPIDRKTLVKAKYLSIYLYYFAASILYVLIYMLNSFLHFVRVTQDVLRPEVFIAGFICAIIISSVNYPAYLKFGITKSRYVMFILFFAIFALAGEISKVIEKSFGNAPDLIGASSSLLGMVICVLTGIVVHYLSYLLSYNLYKNKDL